MPKFKAKTQDVSFTPEEIAIALSEYYNIDGSYVDASISYNCQLVAEMDLEEYEELKASYAGLTVTYQSDSAYESFKE